MSDYDTPKIPPATPPTIDDRASAKDARTKADAEGDSEEDGSRDGASSTKKEREIAEANRAHLARQRKGRRGANRRSIPCNPKRFSRPTEERT